MKLRTIYLQRHLSMNGRNALSGRVLFDRFKELSEEVLLGHLVCDDAFFSRVTDNLLRQDIISHSLLRQFRPDVVYVEGGLFVSGDGTWRIPMGVADEVCANGGVIIVADVDQTLLSWQKEHYWEAGRFFNVVARYGKGESEDPVYASDEVSFWRGHNQIVCKPEKMVLSEWLRPIYDGIPAVLASGPVPLQMGLESTLASCNGDTTGTLHLDRWVDCLAACPFASVAKRGSGFAVFIAGKVSDDIWLEGCPHNTLWLSRVAEFLVEEARRDRARKTTHRRSPHLLFLSHRSSEKKVVRQVASAIKTKGVGIWFDEEQLIPSQSLVEELDRALQNMTHYVLFWSRSCVDAPWVNRELRSAISRLVEKQIPLLIVRLDDTPVPAIVADIFRIEAVACTPDEVASRITDAVERLAVRQ